MGRAIVGGVVTVIIISILAFLAWRMFRRATEIGDLSLADERALRQQVESAARVMRELGVTYDIEDSDILSERSRTAVDKWLHNYQDYVTKPKEINA